MKFELTSPYGELSQIREGAHTGIDIAMETGTKLKSIADGVVFAVRDYGDKGLGKGVIIQTDDGKFHVFGHLSEILVEKGEKIEAGKQILGLSGSTGNSTGPHLHFAIQDKNGEFLDPTKHYDNVIAAINGEPFTIGGKIMEGINDFSDVVIGKEIEWIFKPLFNALGDFFVSLWQWFVLNLPDIMGYTTILAGIIIILSAMAGKYGIIKPFGVWAALMILSICILGGK